ncbi:hypothetical protein BDR04DRAFT_1162883 [Suillus decipiens]|nr:hypothetical protein BDR04DRAFT_1162883 [Suillus decipiens]
MADARPSLRERKVSGLSGFELQQAYNSLIKLRQYAVYETCEEGDPDDDNYEEQIDSFFTFPSMNATDLTEFNILFTGQLILKPNLNERVAATTSLGQNELWSSKNIYRQLLLLESIVPKTTEATARAWIDVFFFRAFAMLPANKAMILNTEHVVPATAITPSSSWTIGGFVDYIVISSGPKFIYDISATLLPQDDNYAIRLLRYGSQVLESLGSYRAGSKENIFSAQKVIRGALTNGREWIFLLVKFNDNYEGASYYRTEDILTYDTAKGSAGRRVIIDSSPDMIAAILSHWIQNSFVDMQSDDWFEVKLQQVSCVVMAMCFLFVLVKDLLLSEVAKIKVGSEFSNFMGHMMCVPFLCIGLRDVGFVQKAKDAGGEEILPAIIQTKDPDSISMKEEILVPVITAMYGDANYEKTLELINSTSPHAPTSSIFLTDCKALLTAANKPHNAACNALPRSWVNDPLEEHEQVGPTTQLRVFASSICSFWREE